MKFSANTTYNLDRLVRFSRYVSIKKRWVWITTGIATAIVSLTFILQLALIGFDATITWAFCGVLFIDTLYAFMCFVLPKITYKKSPALDAVIRYEFYDDTYTITAELKVGKETSELSYSTIKKVMKSNDDIYLFIGPNQAHIVDKSGFELGTADNFEQFIETKIEAKKFLKKRKIDSF